MPAATRYVTRLAFKLIQIAIIDIVASFAHISSGECQSSGTDRVANASVQCLVMLSLLEMGAIPFWSELSARESVLGTTCEF